MLNRLDQFRVRNRLLKICILACCIFLFLYGIATVLFEATNFELSVSSPVAPSDKVLHLLSHFPREDVFKSHQKLRLSHLTLLDTLLAHSQRNASSLLSRANPHYGKFHADGEVASVRDYLDIRPFMKDRLIGLVTNRSLAIGPWFVQPETFLAGGESIIRNLLYGIETSREYGAHSFVGYLSDSSGYVSQLPQIFRGFGINRTLLAAPANKKLVLRSKEHLRLTPSREFAWLGPDGSRMFFVSVGDMATCLGSALTNSGGTDEKSNEQAIAEETDSENHEANGEAKQDGSDIAADFRAHVLRWARETVRSSLATSAIGQSVVMYDCKTAKDSELDSVATVARVAGEVLARERVRVVQSSAAQFLEAAEKAFLLEAQKTEVVPSSGEIFLYDFGHAYPYGRPLTYIHQNQDNWRVTSSLSLYAEPLTAFHWFGLRPDGSVEEETNDTNSDDEASEDSSSSGSRKRAIREKRLLKQDHDAVYDTNMIEYAWKVILRNHAHSRINDNTVAEVNRETEERFGKAMEVTDSLFSETFVKLMSEIDLRRFDNVEYGHFRRWPLFFVAYNPLPQDRVFELMVVAILVPFHGACIRSEKVVVLDSRGNRYQGSILGYKEYQFEYDLPKKGFRKNISPTLIVYIAVEVSLFGVGYHTFGVKFDTHPGNDRMNEECQRMNEYQDVVELSRNSEPPPPPSPFGASIFKNVKKGKVFHSIQNGFMKVSLDTSKPPQRMMKITDLTSGRVHNGLVALQICQEGQPKKQPAQTEKTKLESEDCFFVTNYTVDKAASSDMFKALTYSASVPMESHKSAVHKNLMVNVSLLLPTSSRRLLVRVSLMNHFKNYVLKALFIDTNPTLIVDTPFDARDGIQHNTYHFQNYFFAAQQVDMGLNEKTVEYVNTTGLIIGNRGLPELVSHVIKSGVDGDQQLFVHALTLFRSIEMKNENDWEERWKGPKQSAERANQYAEFCIVPYAFQTKKKEQDDANDNNHSHNNAIASKFFHAAAEAHKFNAPLVAEQILEVNIRGFHARPMIGFERTELGYFFARAFQFGDGWSGGSGSSSLPHYYFPDSNSPTRYLPDHEKFLTVSPANYIFLSSVKKAQRSNSLIVRLYNPTDFGSRTILKVKLFLGRKISEATLCNLNEEDCKAPLTIDVREDHVVIETFIDAKKIATIQLS